MPRLLRNDRYVREGIGLVGFELGGGWGLVGGWLVRSEILRVGQRVSKKKEVEVSRQGRNCHSERREESLWRRSCLEPKIHACDHRIATQLILRFAQYITNYVMSVMTG